MTDKKQRTTETQFDQHNDDDRAFNRHQARIKQEKLEEIGMDIDGHHGREERRNTNTLGTPASENVEASTKTTQQGRKQNHKVDGQDKYKKKEGEFQIKELHFKTVEVKKEKLEEAQTKSDGKYKLDDDVVMLTPDVFAQDVDMDRDDDSQSLKRKYDKENERCPATLTATQDDHAEYKGIIPSQVRHAIIPLVTQDDNFGSMSRYLADQQTEPPNDNKNADDDSIDHSESSYDGDWTVAGT